MSRVLFLLQSSWCLSRRPVTSYPGIPTVADLFGPRLSLSIRDEPRTEQAPLPQLDDTVSRSQECLNPGPRAFKGGKQHAIAAIAEAHPNKARFVLWPRREV